MTLRKFRDALIVMGAFLGVIWLLQVVNWADGYRLDTEFGILPEHLSRLPEIFTAPFLHFNWQHIEGNTVPLFVLGVLAAYRSISRFLLASLIIAVTSGLAVWLFQSSNELTVGASGLIQKLVESAEMGTRIYCAGGWYTGDTLDITTATRQGVTIQFGGGPHPQDWYGTLDAIVAGRLDPLPSVGKIIGLDEVPEALDQARRSDGPPRIVVRPNGDLS